MNKFDHIRFFHNHEVNNILNKFSEHPIMNALLQFTYPEMDKHEVKQLLNKCHSIYQLHDHIICNSVRVALSKSSAGLTTSGFEYLKPNTAYLFISNHRDIILDTSILNLSLKDKNLVMTASAIGDNLVKRKAMLLLSKLNRNFIIQRGLNPKEGLESSKLISEYIDLLRQQGRSVWIAQRQGRTKDGNDETQQGVLKMLSLHQTNKNFAQFKNMNIVPVAISYEFDPTDKLKMSELLSKHYDVEYVKTQNEDFNNILRGALGQKGRIHLHVCSPIKDAIDNIIHQENTLNKQITLLKEHIDQQIHQNFKLWASNYIAHDLLYGKKYSDQYNDKEERQFKNRIEKRIDPNNLVALEKFLEMYATPVINHYKYENL